jgi:hypothetical protein
LATDHSGRLGAPAGREQFVLSFYVFFLLYPELTAMNPGSPSPEFPEVTYIFDSSGRLADQREESAAVPGMTAGGETIAGRSTPVVFEHDNDETRTRIDKN